MKRYIAYAIVLCSVVGCGGNLVPEPDSLQLYGSATRRNSYETGESFAKGAAVNQQVKLDNDSTLPGAITAPLSVGVGELCVGTADGAIARLLDNRLVWKTPLAGGAIPAAALCGDANGNVYVVSNDGAVTSFSADGKQRWRLAAFAALHTTTYSDLLAVSDGIIAGASTGDVLKISFDGRVQWKRHSPLVPTKLSAADAEGNIYVALSNNAFNQTDSLVVVSPKGVTMWALAFEHTRLIKTPVVTSKGVLVAGIRQAEEDRVSVVHSIDKMGRVQWSRELTITPRGVSVANDGTVFVAGYRAGIGEPLSAVIAFSPEGKKLWKMNFEFAIPTPVLVSPDVVAFVGIKGKATGIYYMKRDGTFIDVVSMGDMPIVNLQPVVDVTGSFLFASAEALGAVRVSSGWGHILPF